LASFNPRFNQALTSFISAIFLPASNEANFISYWDFSTFFSTVALVSFLSSFFSVAVSTLTKF
jgi:membrane protein YqaA with SNARE-associated domain